MRAPRPGEAGFTLVEALVSLFVFSLIASGSVAMLMQSVATQKDVTAAHAALRELQTARALLGGDMLQVAQRRTRQPGGGLSPAFASDAQGRSFSFVRAGAEPDPERKVVGELTAVTWSVEEGRLLRRTRTALDPLEGPPPEARVVFESIEDARFEFFDGQVWRPSWNTAEGAAQLPAAVALEGRTPRHGAIRIAVIVEPTP